MAKKYKPFTTGKQFGDWMDRNCDACKKGFYNNRGRFSCGWERALCYAAVENHQIPEEVAKAIGFLDSEGCDLWECPGWEQGRR